MADAFYPLVLTVATLADLLALDPDMEATPFPRLDNATIFVREAGNRGWWYYDPDATTGGQTPTSDGVGRWFGPVPWQVDAPEILGNLGGSGGIVGAVAIADLAVALGINNVIVRNTVLSGPATWLVAGTGLQVLSDNGDAVGTIAEGFNATVGAVNRVFSIPENTSWGSLAASSTLYLYATFDGILATGNSTLAPFYGPNAPSSPTTGQWWFNTATYEGQTYNGSGWDPAPRLYVGQCTTSGSAVTAAVQYAYQGRYVAPITLPSAAGNTNINHLLGVNFPQQILPNKFSATCTTAAHGYSIGDKVEFLSRAEAGRGFTYRSDGASVINTILSNSIAPIQVAPKTGGDLVTPTLSSFDVTVDIKRAF